MTYPLSAFLIEASNGHGKLTLYDYRKNISIDAVNMEGMLCINESIHPIVGIITNGSSLILSTDCIAGLPTTKKDIVEEVSIDDKRIITTVLTSILNLASSDIDNPGVGDIIIAETNTITP